MGDLLTFDVLVGAIDNGEVKIGALYWLGNIVILLVTGMFLYQWIKNYIQVDDDAYDRKVKQLSEDGHLIRELIYRYCCKTIVTILISAVAAWLVWFLLYIAILIYGTAMVIIFSVAALINVAVLYINRLRDRNIKVMEVERRLRRG